MKRKHIHCETSRAQSTFLFFPLYFFLLLFLSGCSGHDSPVSILAKPVVVPPHPPASVSAAPGNAMATLSWTGSDYAASYTIYMAQQSGVTKTNYLTKSGGMAHKGVTSPYVHTGLTNGTTYYFVITSENSEGESAESPEVSAKPVSTTNQFPSAVLTADKTSGALPLQVTFTLSYNDAEGTQGIYLLNFGDTAGTSAGSAGQINSGASTTVQHTYSLSGNYLATLTVADSAGNASMSAVSISTQGTVSPSNSAFLTTGAGHTCALTSSGGIKCWGYNYDGELGNGTYTNSSTPVNVSGLTSGVSSVSAGTYHTCALTSSGGVKCWGSNYNGQLGNSSYTSSSTPVSVTGLTNGVSAVSAGASHACALTSSGGVKCWGSNGYGQLGNGSSTSSSTPVDVTGLTSGVSSVSAGTYHTCALTSSGGVKCWGRNSYGQLGNSSYTNSSTPVNVTGLTTGASAVSAGYHTCALTSSGGVKCWGTNYDGELGNGTYTTSSSPVDATGLTSGTAAVSAGSYHTCALTSSGGVKCWGTNYDGQIGNGTYTTSSIPMDVSGLANSVSAVSAGGSHSCALTSSGGIKCWGDNYYGQLGNGTNSDSPTPASVINF